MSVFKQRVRLVRAGRQCYWPSPITLHHRCTSFRPQLRGNNYPTLRPNCSNGGVHLLREEAKGVFDATYQTRGKHEVTLGFYQLCRIYSENLRGFHTFKYRSKRQRLGGFEDGFCRIFLLSKRGRTMRVQIKS